MRRGGALHHVTPTPSRDAIVVACGVVPVQRARISEALRGRAVVRIVGRFSELMRTIEATIEHIDVVVLGSHEDEGMDAVSATRAIAAARPRTAIIAYCDPVVRSSPRFRALAAAGVHEFVFGGVGDTGVAFRALVDQARRQCAGEFVMGQMSSFLPAPVQPLAEVILSRPDLITSVGTLASALGVHRKTLFNRCERAMCMSPAELIVWVRLGMVGFYLDNTGCTIETIAFEMSFPSDTALRNTLKRYAGRRATELRQAGALETLLGSFAHRISTGRVGRVLHLV
jgi:AraC-like DNA-binding protein